MAPTAARRARIAESIKADPAIHIAGEAPTFPFLRSLLGELDADIAIIDSDGAGDLEVTRDWLSELFNQVTIVLLASTTDTSIFSQFMHADRGAILRSDASGEQIVHAIHAVNTGLMVFEPAVVPHSEELREIAEALTPRENDVLQLLAEGLPNREIASRLGISEHTIKFHIRSILGKLGASSRTEAVTRGLRSGLIEL